LYLENWATIPIFVKIISDKIWKVFHKAIPESPPLPFFNTLACVMWNESSGQRPMPRLSMLFPHITNSLVDISYENSCDIRFICNRLIFDFFAKEDIKQKNEKVPKRSLFTSQILMYLIRGWIKITPGLPQSHNWHNYLYLFQCVTDLAMGSIPMHFRHFSYHLWEASEKFPIKKSLDIHLNPCLIFW